MKHINSQKIFNIQSKIEDLSEYLQEFFDKYRISQVVDETKVPPTDFYWIMYPTYITIGVKTNSSPSLTGISFYDLYDLYRDLLRLQPHLENRLGQKIQITNGFIIEIMLR